MIPGTKPTRKKNPPISASQQEHEDLARQTAAELPQQNTPKVLDRRAAMAAALPAVGTALVKLLRTSNHIRHSIQAEWKKTR